MGGPWVIHCDYPGENEGNILSGLHIKCNKYQACPSVWMDFFPNVSLKLNCLFYIIVWKNGLWHTSGHVGWNREVIHKNWVLSTPHNCYVVLVLVLTQWCLSKLRTLQGLIIAQVYRLPAVHCQATRYSQRVPGYLTLILCQPMKSLLTKKNQPISLCLSTHVWPAIKLFFLHLGNSTGYLKA